MKNQFKKFAIIMTPVLALGASIVPLAHATGTGLDAADIASLGTSSLSDISTNGYTVLVAVAGIIVALILWRFAVKHAKKSVK